MLNASSDFIQALKIPHKVLSIKLEIYDSQMNYLKEITTDTTSDIGYLSVNNSNPIRRSFSIKLNNKDGNYLFGQDNLIWLDKRIRLSTGLRLRDGTTEYVQQGIFVLTEPSDSHDLDGKYTTINAVDKAFFLTDKRGKFINEQTIEVGAKITDAIRIIASHVGETMFNFDEIPTIENVVPYELTYSSTDNRWSAIQELAKLIKCSVYYDVYGYLRLKRVDLNELNSYPSVWTFTMGDNFYAGNTRKMDDGELYNDIVVLGGRSDVAVSRYRLTVDETNPLWTDHPYSIQKIGINTYFHNNGSPDPLLFEDSECKWRAKFELMKSLGYTESVSMNIAPHFLLDADDIIEAYDQENNIEGKYIINSLNIPLSPQKMTLDIQKQVKVIENWDFII
ncbi:hypothetical protein [Metabacillus fastidiosus]|uniref:hypothetical protein n=1 Tax=Metabacillus fastidiosus TaxID=1458 RepID=UPI003D2E3620